MHLSPCRGCGRGGLLEGVLHAALGLNPASLRVWATAVWMFYRGNRTLRQQTVPLCTELAWLGLSVGLHTCLYSGGTSTLSAPAPCHRSAAHSHCKKSEGKPMKMPGNTLQVSKPTTWIIEATPELHECQGLAPRESPAEAGTNELASGPVWILMPQV